MNTAIGKITLSTVVTMLIVLQLTVIFPVAHADNLPLEIITGEGGGGGSAPVVLGMWEQDNSPVLEDGDSTHMQNGAQFLPPCEDGSAKKISIYVIVTEKEQRGEIQTVSVEFQNKNSLAFGTIHCSRLIESQAVYAMDHAAAANLIACNQGMDTKQIKNRLQDNTASVWKGDLLIPPDQTSGTFLVTATGTDNNNYPSKPFQNSFLYYGVACIEFDFNSVNYGNIGLGQEKMITGDAVFGSQDKPSVKNIGNLPARVSIKQDDMGFGKNSDGSWNVHYGIRLGNSGMLARYSPNEEVIIPDLLKPGEIKPLDFTIDIVKGTGSSEGLMKLGFVPVEITEQSYEKVPELPVPEFPSLTIVLESFNEFGNLIFSQG